MVNERKNNMNNFKTLTTLNVFRFFYLINTELDDEYPYNIQEYMSDMGEGPTIRDFLQFLNENYAKLLSTKLNYLNDAYLTRTLNDEEGCDNDAIVLSYLIDSCDEPSVKSGNPRNLGTLLYAEYLAKENLTDVWDTLNGMFENDWDCESFEKFMTEDPDDDDGDPWTWTEEDVLSVFNETKAFINNAMEE